MAFVEEEAELSPQLSPQQEQAMQQAMQRSAASMPDDDEYADFLKRVEDVGATIKGLQDGTVEVSQLDAREAKINKEESDRQARRDAKKREAEEKVAARQEAARKMVELKEANRDKIEELKQDYYLRKAKRERWEAFRAENKSRGNTNDYYRGWDLFEDDPDEELFSGDNPAAVQDQAAFDAMAKDVEERTARRNADKAAGAKEKDAGNAAFKDGQHSEAIARYSCSLEHFKGDKAVYANRALAHIRVRNFLSAVDDCARAIEISRFLDDDFARRPPPPPLLKAYVRRATAYAALQRYGEAGQDLEAAAAMAPEQELAEVCRHQRELKAEVQAAAREDSLARQAADEPGGAAGGQARLLREALERLAADADAAVDVLRDLEPLLASSACCVCLRQAGGIRQLVGLLPSHPEAAARLLAVACSHRRNQLEVHLCGGSVAVLRALRHAQPTAVEEARGAAPQVRTPIAGSAAKVVAVSAEELASLLRLLSLACCHDTVREAVRPLASGEGAYERLTRLLQACEPARAGDVQQAAAELLGRLSVGAAAKKALRPVQAALCAAIVPLLGAADAAVCEAAVSVVGNLSADTACRKTLVGLGGVAGLLGLLRRAGERPGGSLLPNTLGALHNAALLPEALDELATTSTAEALLPHLDGETLMARRAAAVLAKVVARCKEAAALLVERGTVPEIAAALAREADAVYGDNSRRAREARLNDAPEPSRFEDITDGEPAGSPPEGGAAEEEEDLEEKDGLLGALVRLATAAAAQQGAPALLCDAGSLPVLVMLLGRADANMQGNVALCIAESARDEKCLAVLAVQQPLVPKLLSIAHNGDGQTQKNAAIALGRLAKNVHCLQAIRDNHGIEILARSMSKMGMGPATSRG
jgi:hypothetical protein